MSAAQFAIFIGDHRDSGCVLLTDGAWTDPNNCNRVEFGVILHKPKLFKSLRAAQTYKLKHVGAAPRYIVGEWTEPGKVTP